MKENRGCFLAIIITIGFFVFYQFCIRISGCVSPRNESKKTYVVRETRRSEKGQYRDKIIELEAEKLILRQEKEKVKEKADKELKKKIIALEAKHEKELRAKEIKTMVNPTVKSSDKITVAISIQSEKEFLTAMIDPEATLLGHLQSKNTNVNIIGNYFSPVFKEKNYFNEAFNGETRLLQETKAFDTIDYLTLCRLEYSCKENKPMNNLVSCTIHLSFKTLAPEKGFVDSGSLRVISPAFSESEALDKGLKMLIEENPLRMFKNLLKRTSDNNE